MTTLREAAQQALEALKSVQDHRPNDETNSAIRTLRAALAEPVTADMKSAVRWAPSSAYWSERLREFFGPDARDGIDALERRLAEAQQAEPVQEPIGYLWPTGGHPEFRFTQQKRDGVEGTPIYTAPPQRKPLTEEEIDEAWHELDGEASRLFLHLLRRFVRIVEAAHGIKEAS